LRKSKEVYNANINRFNQKKQKEDFISNLVTEIRASQAHQHAHGLAAVSHSQSVLSRSASLNLTPNPKPNTTFPIKHSQPVPAEIRKNPFAVIPTLGMKDLKKGVYTLVNQGYLPTSHIDLTPALDRNDPLIKTKPMSPKELLRQESLPAFSSDQNRLRAMAVASSDDQSNASKTLTKTRENFAQQDAVPEHAQALVTVPPLDTRTRFLHAQENPDANSAAISTSKRAEQKVPTAEELLRVKNQKYLEVVNSQLLKNDNFSRLKSLHLLCWGDLAEVASKAISFAASKKIQTFRLYFSRLKDLSTLMREPTPAELVSCIENYQMSLEFVSSCGVKVENTTDHTEKMMRVALKIQKNFRKLIARRLREQLADIRRKIVMIQFKYKLKRIYQDTVRRADEIKAKKYKQYLKVHQRFVEDWAELSAGPRVEIHLCNFGSLR